MHCVAHARLAPYVYITPHASAHLPHGCARQVQPPTTSSYRPLHSCRARRARPYFSASSPLPNTAAASRSSISCSFCSYLDSSCRADRARQRTQSRVLPALAGASRPLCVRHASALGTERRPDLVGVVPVLVHVHEARHAQRRQSERLARRPQRSRRAALVLLPQVGGQRTAVPAKEPRAGAWAPRAHLGIDTGVDDLHLRRDGLGPLVRERAGDRRRPEVACRRARAGPRRCGALLWGAGESGANGLEGGRAHGPELVVDQPLAPAMEVRPARLMLLCHGRFGTPAHTRSIVRCQRHCVVSVALCGAAAGGTLRLPTRGSQAQPWRCTSITSYLKSACVPHASHSEARKAQQTGVRHRLLAPPAGTSGGVTFGRLRPQLKMPLLMPLRSLSAIRGPALAHTVLQRWRAYGTLQRTALARAGSALQGLSRVMLGCVLQSFT
jgi:hypothetical protein